MQEVKYYVPEIEEFCIGFEYEEYQQKEWNKLISPPKSLGYEWVKKVFNTSTSLGKIKSKLEKIRVKSLDTEDIESCGFNKINEKEKVIPFKKTDSCFGIYFYPDDRRKLLIYYDIYDYEGCIFDGYVNNKNELQKILKQLRQNGTN